MAADWASGAGARGGVSRGGRIAPFAAAALLIAAGALAVGPAMSDGPLRWPALGLIGFLIVVAAIGLVLVRTRSAAPVTADADMLVRALVEPAVIVSEDGALGAANGAWREAVGPHRRLQRAGLGDAPALLRLALRDGH